MVKVLFLYTNDENENAEELKDYLQAKMGNAINFINIVDILAEELDLEDELEDCACVVLVCSKQANDCIKYKREEIVEDFVTFDGSVISNSLSRGMVDKLLVVCFQKGVSQWEPDGIKTKRIYKVREKFSRKDPVFDQLADSIQAIITPCTTA